MEKKTKITLLAILSFVVVVTIATPFVLKMSVNKSMDHMQTELQNDLTALKVSSFTSIFPKLTNTAEAFKVTIDVPEAQEVEVSTAIDGQTLKVSGKFINKVERESSNYRSTASSQQQFNFSFKLTEPIDAASMHTKREAGRMVVIIPKAE